MIVKYKVYKEEEKSNEKTIVLGFATDHLNRMALCAVSPDDGSVASYLYSFNNDGTVYEWNGISPGLGFQLTNEGMIKGGSYCGK